MAYGDQSVFNFDLNESLWFKKGQEVDEIMGISLEPEISIQEFDDFVSIRGVIELKGEYFQVRESGDDEQQVLSMRDHPSQRFVDRIESYEDGVNEFFHNFPVEVSIPKYRINSLDDVMVGIESFDYELPENSQLKLNAIVAIHGVVEDRDEPQENQEDVEVKATPEPERETEELVNDEPVDEDSEKSDDETFEFDVKKKEEEEDRVDLELDESTGEVESVEKAKTPEKERWKSKKSQSLAEFFGKIDKPKDAEMTENSVESSESSSIVSFASYSKDESVDESESRAEETQQNTTYLLNIFGDKEEDRYSSMKLCIVQDSDSLESLAEKYDISALNITKTNRLTDDELSEGQILYIPTKDKKVE
ncbi:stage VI sporulation protein D [Aquibacillus saliphilus]|uniref:stage VI sporulation protein D n=1 Tax=Aquibacillus saliphilus TaxID=1909422 RepID=UPI001CF058A2|nr:stage VI sporulation protein D [Aquibacillus saliphilus]